MIGRSGSRTGSAGAFASHASRGAVMRPKRVVTRARKAPGESACQGTAIGYRVAPGGGGGGVPLGGGGGVTDGAGGGADAAGGGGGGGGGDACGADCVRYDDCGAPRTGIWLPFAYMHCMYAMSYRCWAVRYAEVP